MRNSLLRDFYLVSLFFIVLKITSESKNHEERIAHYFEYISI